MVHDLHGLRQAGYRVDYESFFPTNWAAGAMLVRASELLGQVLRVVVSNAVVLTNIDSSTRSWFFDSIFLIALKDGR